MSRKVAFLGVFVMSLFLVACGKGEAPPPPPPPAPGTGVPVAGLGGALEAQSGGTPWAQLSRDARGQALQAMSQNLVGLGIANIQGQPVALDYVVSNGAMTRLPGQQPPPQTGIITYNYEGAEYGNGVAITLAAQYGGQRTFMFVPDIYRFGLRLESTDQIALFESYDRGYEILKVAYRAPSGPMEWYTIELTNSYGNQAQIHVIQKIMAPTIQPAYGQNGWPR